ncbi:MAG: hypothetical protein IKM59_00990 [Oscillospiraceae bacterium]|nr:hypothetical protein [Oscillospiraceae bacterium]
MKRCLSVILLLSLLLLGGCTEPLPDYILEVPTTEPTTESITEESITETTTPKEWREYATYPVERPTDKAIGNALYYTEARAVSYYDTELRRTVYMCSQPNCAHSDEKCYAYLGGSMGSTYTVSGDMVYALVDNFDVDGTIRLIERNLVTGDTRTLMDLTPEEDMYKESLNFSLCGEELFLTYRQCRRTYTFEGNVCIYHESDSVQHSYAIDLLTGEQELLLEAKIPSVQGYGFGGSAIVPQMCTRDYLLIQKVEFKDVLPLSEEEYYKQEPNGDYLAYTREVFLSFSTDAYYAVNRKTGERKQICGGMREARLEHGGYRDKKMPFVDGTTVCVYDGYTGQVTPYFEQDRIGFMTLMDGRIVYNVYPEEGSGTEVWDFFWYDLTTGESHQFQEGIGTMVFSVHEETADYFHGNYNGRSNCFISKQDFYNENYDGAF